MGKEIDWEEIEKEMRFGTFAPEQTEARFNAALKNMIGVPLNEEDRAALSYGPYTK